MPFQLLQFELALFNPHCHLIEIPIANCIFFATGMDDQSPDSQPEHQRFGPDPLRPYHSHCFLPIDDVLQERAGCGRQNKQKHEASPHTRVVC